MKKTSLAILITAFIVSAIFMISCTSNNPNSNEGNNAEVNSNNNVESSSSNNADSSNTQNSNSSQKTNDASKKNEPQKEFKKESKNTHDSFYGKWTIKRLIKYGRVNALSEEDVKNLIGKKIEFSSSCIKYNDISYTNPTYKFEEKTDDKLMTYSRVSFKDLNITNDKVTIINVDKYDNMKELANSDKDLLGFYLIVSENGSPIIAIDGDYFELAPNC